MRDMKKYTSVEIIQSIENSISESRKEWMIKLFSIAGKQNPNNVKFQFWQQDNHPVELTSNSMMDQKLDYIHNNPVEHGFVKKPEDYPWSSISDYIGEKGIVNVELIE